MMEDFIKKHGKEFIRTFTAVVAALVIAAPPAAQFIDDVCVSVEEGVVNIKVVC